MFNPLTSLGLGSRVAPLASLERFARVRVENLGKADGSSFHRDAHWKGEEVGRDWEGHWSSDAEETEQRHMMGEEEQGCWRESLGSQECVMCLSCLPPHRMSSQFYIPSHALWHWICFWRGKCQNWSGGKQSIPIDSVTLGSHLCP